jgi:hypothetical protein
MKRTTGIAISVVVIGAAFVCSEQIIYWESPSLLYESQPTLPPPENAAEALALLTPEKHVADPYTYLEGSRWELARKYPAYLQQIDALKYLREHKVTAGIPSLILYLDYGTSREQMLLSQLNPGPTFEEMKEIYPAYGALIEMPEAKDIVEAYALNQANPVAYRIACLEVLWGIDPATYDNTWSALKEQIQDPEVQAYLGYLKEGRVGFCGVPVFSKK